jgi:hypothetical protein
MKEEALNVLITVVINLFVLSMVSERLVNFLKLNFQKLYTWGLLPSDVKQFLFFIFGNFRDKENSKKAEKLRERGVLNWAIFCSLIVAFASKADLFYLIRCGELPMDTPYGEIDKIGITLTAFFISLGSKFWHDLLDILYFYKNARQKLSDGNLPDFDEADTTQEFMETPYSKIYQGVVASNTQFFGDKNVLYTLNGRVREGSKELPCLVVHVKSKANFNMPDYMAYQLPKSKANVNVKIIVVEDTKPKIHSFLTGAEIGNKGKRGTICCVLVDGDGDKFIMTCNHVLNGGGRNGKGGLLTGSDRESINFMDSEGNSQSGEWHYSECNERLDIALVKLTEEVDFQDNPDNLSSFVKKLNANDRHNLEISMEGLISGHQEGIIIDFDSQPIEIDYDDSSRALSNLIVIGNGRAGDFDYQSSDSISQRGDSGALIYTRNNPKPVGVIIAGSTLYSFAIPLSYIFEREPFASMKIITNP